MFHGVVDRFTDGENEIARLVLTETAVLQPFTELVPYGPHFVRVRREAESQEVIVHQHSAPSR